jgi:hypothetical protein
MSAIVVLGGAAVPAWAAPVPRLRPPVVKQLPRPAIEVPRPAVAVPDEIGSAGRYGIDDPETVAALDDARARVTDDVEATASQVGANAEGRARIKECTGEGLKAAGKSYEEDVQEAASVGELPPAPDFTEVSAATGACLRTYFPNEPEVLFRLGTHLANLAAERARESYFADPPGPPAAVIANWMTTTGSELSSVDSTTAAETPISAGADPTTEADEGSSFPWWALVVALLAGSAFVLAVRAKKS